MFEKEAENNKPLYAYCSFNTNCELWKDGFQKGAEFGYNKAKEDADKMKSRFLELCNLKDMRIAKLEKANEWHDLRKNPNDLPKGHKVVLNQIGEKTTYDPDRGFLGFGGCGIIAWKEIPLFKESE